MPSYQSLELEALQRARAFGTLNVETAGRIAAAPMEHSRLLLEAIRAPNTPETAAEVRLIAGSTLNTLIVICACYDVNLTDGLAEALK